MLRPALILFTFIAIGISITAQSQPASTPKHRVAKEDSGAKAEITDAGQGKAKPSPVTVIVKQENTPNRQEADSESEENIAIQRKLANLTLGLVIVGAVQAAILIGTIVAVVKQTDANRTIERAWVLVDVQSDPRSGGDKATVMHGSGTSGDSTGVFASLSFQNEGRSPAHIYEIIAKFRIVEILPPVPDFSNKDARDGDFVEYEPIILGIGQACPRTKDLRWLAIAEGHSGDGKLSVLYGVVRYFDIFDKKREARFGYCVGPDRKLSRLTNREYNKQT